MHGCRPVRRLAARGVTAKNKLYRFSCAMSTKKRSFFFVSSSVFYHCPLPGPWGGILWVFRPARPLVIPAKPWYHFTWSSYSFIIVYRQEKEH
jgi:hypothetical protein